MLRILLRGGILTVVCLIAGAVPGLACSCLPRSTADLEFKQSKEVVLVTLEGFETLPRDPAAQYFTYNNRAAVFRVDKAYKGTMTADSTITVYDGGGGDCSKGFSRDRAGQKFLFYLGETRTLEPQWGPMHVVSICGRSATIEDARLDVSYLDRREANKGRSRISGRVRSYSGVSNTPSVESLEVHIKGPVERTVQTDKDGFFEAWDLPPGEYEVRADARRGWRVGRSIVSRISSDYRSEPLAGDPPKLTLLKGRHAEALIFLMPDNEISGTVVGPDGKAMSGACMYATSAEYPNHLWGGGTSVCTDRDGRFTVKEVPAGSFFLHLNPNGLITNESPFERFIYPANANGGPGLPIVIQSGASVRDLMVRIPKVFPLFEIKGVLQFQDGVPIPGEVVTFSPFNALRYKRIEVKTDMDGKFSFTVPQSAVGIISSQADLHQVARTKCGRAVEGKFVVNSGTANFDGSGSRTGIELVVPSPSCSDK